LGIPEAIDRVGERRGVGRWNQQTFASLSIKSDIPHVLVVTAASLRPCFEQSQGHTFDSEGNTKISMRTVKRGMASRARNGWTEMRLRIAAESMLSLGVFGEMHPAT